MNAENRGGQGGEPLKKPRKERNDKGQARVKPYAERRDIGKKIGPMSELNRKRIRDGRTSRFEKREELNPNL